MTRYSTHTNKAQRVLVIMLFRSGLTNSQTQKQLCRNSCFKLFSLSLYLSSSFSLVSLYYRSNYRYIYFNMICDRVSILVFYPADCFSFFFFFFFPSLISISCFFFLYLSLFLPLCSFSMCSQVNALMSPLSPFGSGAFSHSSFPLSLFPSSPFSFSDSSWLSDRRHLSQGQCCNLCDLTELALSDLFPKTHVLFFLSLLLS